LRLIELTAIITFWCTLIYPVLKSYTGNWWYFYFFSIVCIILLSLATEPINSSIPFKMGAKNTHQVILTEKQKNIIEEE
jgi:hypothetical protein